jgi:pimeloyl-ACP methyl ester carboxylesterase
MAYPGDGRLPIIYVRGYAGDTKEINNAVDDPFYGFSQGSVHVRADSKGQPIFYQFESPMLRLIADKGYQVPVYGDQTSFLEHAVSGKVDAATVWIHRFYDVSASTLAKSPKGFSLEAAAENLFDLIQLVRDRTGAPKVFLVAHSMGGLICRAALQRIIPEALSTDTEALNLAAGHGLVARVFTYATPHGGIKFAVGNGVLERIRDATGVYGADVFGPERMYQYLTPGVEPGAQAPDTFSGTEMPEDGFPLGELFCLVGSNPVDYDAAYGLSSKAVGARSDGLVQIENAAVQDAHRAIVHRSHSGRYGIVNSEAGYQNLQRFLFGDLQIKAELVGFAVGRNAPPGVEFQLDVSLAIRGLPVLVHEQSAAHYCPILIQRPATDDTIDTPQPLLTTFLSSTAPRPMNGAEPVPTLRHALNLRLLSIREEEGRFLFTDHLEQTEDWSDSLLVDIEPASGEALPRAWAVWKSEVDYASREWEPSPSTEMKDLNNDLRRWVGEKPVPLMARNRLGQNARIRLTVIPRTVPT